MERDTITLNGSSHEIDGSQTITELLGALGLPPKGLLVELNGAPVVRDAWDTTTVVPGDTIEVVRFIGGG